MQYQENIGNSTFTFKTVETPEELEDVYALRYQVYCEECQFIRPEDYPERKERDDYDPHSVHFAVYDPYGIVGTTRLILNSALSFPLEQHCHGNLNVDPSDYPRDELAEISRLVISKKYRRRTGDGLYYSPDGYDQNKQENDSPKRIRPLAFGLYKLLYQVGAERGIRHAYSLMERSLWKLLRMHGFSFHPIGEEIDFYGPVKPYILHVDEIEKNLKRKNIQVRDYFLQNVA